MILRGIGFLAGRCRLILPFGASNTHAGVVKLVDAPDSKSGSERSVGSIPTARTIFSVEERCDLLFSDALMKK